MYSKKREGGSITRTTQSAGCKIHKLRNLNISGHVPRAYGTRKLYYPVVIERTWGVHVSLPIKILQKKNSDSGWLIVGYRAKRCCQGHTFAKAAPSRVSKRARSSVSHHAQLPIRAANP